MSAPSSMWSSRPPSGPTCLEDHLTPEELAIIRKMRAKKDAALKKALRTRERAARLAALEAEIEALKREEREHR